DASNGVEECEQVKKVISLMSDTNQFSFRGRDAGGFLECVLSDVALNASNANTLYSTYLSLETSIDNQRISISGVDEDEEAVSLVKYQNSYTLASKMISTLTEIYDRLILQTGV
ncbi:MAG: flagellar hook-associated protein FlgK, partial [Lachnospiraceae bacterium]|nr:flagellar hook-associated protein FlgK [Lachnospiraceae bacterium]